MDKTLCNKTIQTAKFLKNQNSKAETNVKFNQNTFKMKTTSDSNGE